MTSLMVDALHRQVPSRPNPVLVAYARVMTDSELLLLVAWQDAFFHSSMAARRWTGLDRHTLVRTHLSASRVACAALAGLLRQGEAEPP